MRRPRHIIFAVPLLASAALAAFAAEPARSIDMTTILLDQKGKPIPDATQLTPDDPACAKCGPLTLGSAIATALLTERKDEPNVSSLDKARRAALALRLIDDKAATLTAKQTADIVRLMNLWGGIVVVRVLPILDPALDLSDK
jgi:hypothetical protein